MRLKIIFFLSLAAISCPTYAFEVYAFVPYRMDNGNNRPDLAASQKFFEEIAVKEIKVVYEKELFDQIIKTKNPNLANPTLIKKVAQESDASGKIPVSLDVESWDRFDKATPSRYADLLTQFKKNNPTAKVGLYSTIPQNIYKWDEKNKDKYAALNERYRELSQHVDYISPSLYNYSGRRTADWMPAASYSIQAAKTYGAGKPIIPYITPEISKKHKDYQWLSYAEMLERLTYIKKSGAAGVIIWTSSGAKDIDGNFPMLSMNEGWVKAVADFQAGKEAN